MAEMMTDVELEDVLARVRSARTDLAVLVRSVDPSTPVLDGTWSVRDVVAHLVSVSGRYLSMARTGAYRRAETPREVDLINAVELAALDGRPLPDLLGQLEEDAPAVEEFMARAVESAARFTFHAGALVDGIVGATNWLGELRIHGHDVAQAAGVPWSLPERDMLLVASGLQQIAPAYLDTDRARGVNLVVELRVPDARPWTVAIHDGAARTGPREPGDRPHAVVRCKASTLALLLYQRIGPVAAARQGMLVLGGSRPWRAAALQRMFQNP